MIIRICAASLMLASSVAHAAPAKKSIYAYWTSNNNWCAVGDLASLNKAMNSGESSQFEVDQAEILFEGDKIVSIKEFRTNEDAEWSTLANYKIVNGDKVSAVIVKMKGGEPIRESSISFHVMPNGSYVADKGKIKADSVNFRKADTLASFPFLALISKVKMGNQEKACG